MSSTSLSWVKVDDTVEVACDQGYFHVAKVTDVRTERGRREIYVHYPRGSKTWDEWVRAPARVRPHTGAVQRVLDNVMNKHGTNVGHVIVDGDVCFLVERIIGEGRREGKFQYLVEWTGDYPASYEPPENILDDDLIDDWERRKRQAARQKKCKKKKRRPPHVLTVPSVANVSEAVQTQRRDDAAFMETKIAKSMVKTLHKQSTGSKSQHVLFAMEDAPEWIYVALHERLGLPVRALVGAKQLASQLTAGGAADRPSAYCADGWSAFCVLNGGWRKQAPARGTRGLFLSAGASGPAAARRRRVESETHNTRGAVG